MFVKYKDTAEVFRQIKTTSGGYTKKEFSLTHNFYCGRLKNQEQNDFISQQSFSRNYIFTTNITADIEEGDRLKINNDYYDVKGVSDFDGVSFSVKKILLNKQ